MFSSNANPRQEFVDSYLMSDGLAPGVSTLDSSNYQNRDPRFYHTIYPQNDPWANGKYEPTPTGWYVKKFFDPAITDAEFITKLGTSDQDIVQIRYADVLLIYAEAMHRLGSFDQGVYDETIGLIRTRAGMAQADVTTMSDDQKFNLINYERSVELAFEGHRHFDLKRWGLLDDALQSLTDPLGFTIRWEDHYMLWPFSDRELRLNTNLDQTRVINFFKGYEIKKNISIDHCHRFVFALVVFI